MNENETGVAIRRIGRDSVHRICSGQVVLSLAVAIKELIENSLDANATNIEIRLKEYGAESIEVIDNGCGVEEKDFENLTIKHCTSKLTEFEDLTSVETFGFRGEALSSLCALSKVSIITCHETSSVGTMLEYDHSGNLTKKVDCPRQVGTTVRVQDLFSTLPVRHKEFSKNLKREFVKAVTMMHGYCLVLTDKRIACTNQVGKIKNAVISMSGTGSSRDNILGTFGAKQLSYLMEIKQCPPSVTVIEEYGLLSETAVCNDFFRIAGFVSAATHGQGRSASDRHFYSINGRPCDLPKVMKVVNEVYHSYNKHQYPFLVLDISVKKDSVDLNVTPDKRHIFVENEKLLLAIIKTSLIALYEPQSSQLNLSSPAVTGNCDDSPTVTSCLSKLNNSSSFSRFKRDSSFLSANSSITESPPSIKQPRLDSFFERSSTADETDENGRSVVPVVKEKSEDKRSSSFKMTFSSEIMALARSRSMPSERNANTGKQSTADDVEVVPNQQLNDIHISPLYESPKLIDLETEVENVKNAIDAISADNVECQIIEETQPKHKNLPDSPVSRTKVKILPFSIDRIRQKLTDCNGNMNGSPQESVRKFRAKIDPSANSDAEQELTQEFHRDMFAEMDIVGQFNLGFIIAKLKSDLFIIDQHATDEKYNYEALKKNTILETQKLISPQSLDLTVASETLLIENLEVFRMNGFGFDVNMSADTGNRIRLSSVPVSKNWTFGKQDIEEMLFMLSDSPPGVMCRPSRVQQMLASRACRKSVMIGTSLAHQDMKKLVNHMGEMDQPWNCPHGRPTMRHLVSLGMIR